MSKKNYHNIIDFGSSKIRMTVFDEKLNNLYSDSIFRNLSQNNLLTFNDLKQKVMIAEKKISSHIEDSILMLDNKDMLVIDISLNKNLESKSEVDKVYNSLLLELYQIINNNYNHLHITNVIFSGSIIDNETYEELPKNKKIFNNIRATFKLICFPKIIITNLKNDFNKNNLNIPHIFCTSFLKSLAYSIKLNLENVCFLEIGYERTSFIVFKKNKINYIQSIPVGSFHITKDISKVLNITIEDAEKIKKSFNKSETEFSYKNESDYNMMTAKDIINKNISIDLLKKIILYRVQEIIDLSYKKSKNMVITNNLELFLIGDGSILFKNNSFYLTDKFGFNSINYFEENDIQICNSGLAYYLNQYNRQRKTVKKQGLFEKFFNFFDK